jgi:glycosyltransferase involved in cell wall biosynthesis
VPVRNEAAVIGQTAPAIVGQRVDGPVEFLVVDGRSSDGTRQVLEELAARDDRVKLLDNPAGDLASALHIGLQHAQGEFVSKMDAHTFYAPDYLQVGIDRLRRGDVDWVSGPPMPFGVDRGSRRVATALGTRMGVGGSRKWATSFNGSGPDEIELDTGVFCGVWRRTTLEAVGGWDPEWPANEDAELAARYLRRGARIMCVKGMGARYVPRSTLRGLARQYWRYGYYRAKTARRHANSLRRSHLLPVAVVLTPLPALLPGRAGKRVALLGVMAYLGAVVAASVPGARRGPRTELLALPAVLVVLHCSWGAGFVVGSARFGPPLGALRSLLRRTPASS